MKKIIEKIYYGQMNPEEDKIDLPDGRREKENTAHEVFYNLLSKPEKKLFEEFFTVHMNNICDEESIIYERGVKMGFWLAMELADFEP